LVDDTMRGEIKIIINSKFSSVDRSAIVMSKYKSVVKRASGFAGYSSNGPYA